MQERSEKKQINIVLRGSYRAILDFGSGIDLNLMIRNSENRTDRKLILNDQVYFIIARYDDLELEAKDADVIIYLDTTNRYSAYGEKIRKNNLKTIAIDFYKIGLSSKECIFKIPEFIRLGRSSIDKMIAQNVYKSTLIMHGNTDNSSILSNFPKDITNVISVTNTLNYNYSKLSFFTQAPNELTNDQASKNQIFKI